MTWRSLEQKHCIDSRNIRIIIEHLYFLGSCNSSQTKKTNPAQQRMYSTCVVRISYQDITKTLVWPSMSPHVACCESSTHFSSLLLRHPADAHLHHHLVWAAFSTSVLTFCSGSDSKEKHLSCLPSIHKKHRMSCSFAKTLCRTLSVIIWLLKGYVGEI